MATRALPPQLGGLESICRRYRKAVARRDAWAYLYREAYDFSVPNRQTFDTVSEGAERGAELFDSTAETSVQEFASRLQATICPPWREWSTLAPGPGLAKPERDDPKIAAFLKEQTAVFHGFINHSNFAQKSHESFIDLAVGMGALRCDLNESFDGLQFDSIPISRLAIEESPFGMVETTFEDKRLSVRSLQRLYRGELQLPAEWTRKGQEEAEKCFVQAVIYEPKAKAYHLVIFSETPRALLYYAALGSTNPVLVFRWSVVPGEISGRGPVLSALPDIRTLNKVMEFVLRGAALTLSPPLTGVADGTLNPYTAMIAPDTVIPVASNDNSNPSLRPLLSEIRPELGQFILEDMRKAVRQKLLADPRRREGPIQSATEVLVEDREFVQQTGAAFGRIQAELIERLVNRVVDLLQRIGRMARLKVDGMEVQLKHTSPLARAQDNEELMALQNGVGLAQVAAGQEAFALAVKVEEIPGYVFRKAGLPADLVRTADEREEKLQQIQQQMAIANAQAAGAQPAPVAAA